MRFRNAQTGTEARRGSCALYYRPASKRSASRWCGPAAVVDVKRDAVALPYEGGIREVQRNWDRFYISPTNSPYEGPNKTPPVSAKGRIPDKFDPPDSSLGHGPESPLSIRTKQGENHVAGPDSSPENASPARERASASKDTETFDDLVAVPGRVLQEKCNKSGYRRKGSKRELAARIPERAKKVHAHMGMPPKPNIPGLLNTSTDPGHSE